MSTRIHIGETDSDAFDRVVANAKRVVLVDGPPWRITIGDIELFKKVQPALKAGIERWGGQWPDDVWLFNFIDGDILFHPDQDALDQILNEST